jgi:hypothetical protein
MEVQGVNIKNENVNSILECSKLNWSVRTEELQTASGIIIPENIAIIRNDTNKVLSVRGKDYQPYQNEQMAELIYKVSDKTGLKLHRGGFFNDGAKTFIQLKSGDLTLGNDKIEGQISILNSYDGSTSLCWGNSTLTISCLNTFFGAMKQLDNKIRHTKNMAIRIEDVCRKVEMALNDEKELFNNIMKLSETPLDKAIKDQIIRTFFKIPKDVDLTDNEQISTRTQNQISRFYIDMDGELKEKGQTLWGGLSSLTKFTTHSISKGKKDYDSDSKLFNQYGDRERLVYNQLISMV